MKHFCRVLVCSHAGGTPRAYYSVTAAMLAQTSIVVMMDEGPPSTPVRNGHTKEPEDDEPSPHKYQIKAAMALFSLFHGLTSIVVIVRLLSLLDCNHRPIAVIDRFS
jgi:hypothetical protein